MGEFLLNIFRRKENRPSIITAAVTACIFYLTHSFSINNLLITPDSVSYPEFYNTEQRILYGRWFLSPACAIGSFYDIRPLNAFLMCLYLVITVLLIIKIFEIKNIIVSVAVGGTLATFFTVALLTVWMYTADGYMLSMLFSVLALYLIKDSGSVLLPAKEKSGINKTSLVRSLCAAVILCLSAGIYQTYISVYITLAAGLFIFRSLKNENESVRAGASWIVNKITVCVIACGLYYVVWKICCKVFSVTPSPYQGIDSVGSNVSQVLASAPGKISLMMRYYLNMGEHMTLFGGFICAAYLLFIAVFVFACVKKKLYSRPFNFAVSVAGIILFPAFSFIFFFASSDIWYHGIMTMSLVVPLILIPVFAEEFLTKTSLKNAVLVFLALFIFAQCVYDNVIYLNAYMTKETTEANGAEMKVRIDDAVSENGGKMPQYLYVIGRMKNSHIIDPDTLKGSVMTDNLLIEGAYVRNWLYYAYGYDFILVNDGNYDITPPDDFDADAMPAWPDRESVRIVNDVLVIKVSDE